MKHHAAQFAAITLTVLAAVASRPARAEFKCDRANLSLPDATACAKAAESLTALRHYVQRTRSMHGLYMWDYVRRDEPVPTQVAGHEDEAPGKPQATRPDTIR
jgi:hypothetical protein